MTPRTMSANWNRPPGRRMRNTSLKTRQAAGKIRDLYFQLVAAWPKVFLAQLIDSSFGEPVTVVSQLIKIPEEN